MNYRLIMYPDMFYETEREIGRYDTWAEADEERIYWQEKYGMREQDFVIEEIED